MCPHTIFSALKKDHERLHALLEKLAERTGGETEETRAELLAEFTALLPLHTTAEEEVFYDALEEHEGLHDLVVEGAEEHAAAQHELRQLRAVLSGGGDPWHAQLTVLRDLIEQHIVAEEGETFAKARELLSEERLVALAVEFEELKDLATKEARPVEAG